MLGDGVLSEEASCHWAEVTMALSLVSPEGCRGQGESLTAVRGVPPTLHNPLTVQTCTNNTVHFGDHKCTNKLNACACVVDLKKIEGDDILTFKTVNVEDEWIFMLACKWSTSKTPITQA